MEQLSLAGLGFEMSADEDKKGLGVSPDLGETISGSKAMQMLELSRHTFEKVVKAGTIKQHNNSSISPNKLIAKITSYIFVSTVTILSFLKYTIHKSNV